MGKWKELAEPLDDTDAPTMKPTQEQVIAWAREAGVYHIAQNATGSLLYMSQQSLYRGFFLAYEAGRKHENEACAKVVDEMAEKDKLSNYYRVAALAIRERGAP